MECEPGFRPFFCGDEGCLHWYIGGFLAASDCETCGWVFEFYVIGRIRYDLYPVSSSGVNYGGVVYANGNSIIISKPQPETWVSRLYNTPWATARRSLPAMAHFALLNIIPAELCAYAVKLNVHPAARSVIFILGLFVSVFVAFPAMVALIRVQASLLPDTQEAIVSFDRSFGKQDGMSAVSFKEALRSVGCAGWKRIYKLVIKTVLITLALAGVVVTIVGVEMIWVMAGAPKKELGSAFSLGV